MPCGRRLTIDDDVLDAARAIAEVRREPVGAVLSDLARRGLRPAPRIAVGEDGLPVFTVSANARRFTDEDVARGLEDW